MRRIRAWIVARVTAFPLILSIVFLAGCNQQLPSSRYKLSVIVDTPEGRRVGSSVVELRAQFAPRIPGPDAGGTLIDEVGEAVVVPLPGKRYLFATLKWPASSQRFIEVLTDCFADQLPSERAELRSKGDDRSSVALVRAVSRVRGACTVSPANYPVLAYFNDRAIASTVQTVPAGQLSSTYGLGYRMVGITIESTSDPITTEIKTLLPWLQRSRHAGLDPKTYGKLVSELNEAQLLEHADFAKGEIR